MFYFSERSFTWAFSFSIFSISSRGTLRALDDVTAI